MALELSSLTRCSGEAGGYTHKSIHANWTPGDKDDPFENRFVQKYILIWSCNKIRWKACVIILKIDNWCFVDFSLQKYDAYHTLHNSRNTTNHLHTDDESIQRVCWHIIFNWNDKYSAVTTWSRYKEGEELKHSDRMTLPKAQGLGTYSTSAPLLATGSFNRNLYLFRWIWWLNFLRSGPVASISNSWNIQAQQVNSSKRRQNRKLRLFKCS